VGACLPACRMALAASIGVLHRTIHDRLNHFKMQTPTRHPISPPKPRLFARSFCYSFIIDANFWFLILKKS
jgi:hypothetical protein